MVGSVHLRRRSCYHLWKAHSECCGWTRVSELITSATPLRRGRCQCRAQRLGPGIPTCSHGRASREPPAHHLLFTHPPVFIPRHREQMLQQSHIVTPAINSGDTTARPHDAGMARYPTIMAQPRFHRRRGRTLARVLGAKALLAVLQSEDHNRSPGISRAGSHWAIIVTWQSWRWKRFGGCAKLGKLPAERFGHHTCHSQVLLELALEQAGTMVCPVSPKAFRR
jgi:hypothetical protein